jgi:tol-pal system protein YbgF
MSRLALIAALSLSAVPAVFAADSNRELQDRIERLEQQLRSGGLAELTAQQQAMREELQRLQGELEVQAHTLEELEKNQRAATQDFDRRLREMEQRLNAGGALPPANPELTPGVPGVDAQGQTLPGSPPPVILPGSEGNLPPASAPPPVVAAPPVQIPQPATLPGSPDEQAAYQQAFSQLKEGRYDQAIAGFRAFLTRYPQGVNADNAQYWLGEAYYVKRSFKEAEQAFRTLLDSYPNTAKRPDATLKIGFIHYELGRWAEARKTLNEVKSVYPGSPAAQLADVRLQKMTKEGH